MINPFLLAQFMGNGTGTGGSLPMPQGLLAPRPPMPSIQTPGPITTQAAPNVPVPIQPQNLTAHLGPLNYAQQPSNWLQRLFGSNYPGFNNPR